MASVKAFPCLFDLYEWIHATPGLNAAAREAILDRLGTLLVSLTPRAAAYRRAWRPVPTWLRFSVCFEMRSASELVKQVPPRAGTPRGDALGDGSRRGERQDKPLRCVRGQPNASSMLKSPAETSRRWMSWRASFAAVARASELIVQTLQGMSSRLLPNLATKIMGRMGSNKDYRELGSDLAMSREQLEWARRNLRPGTYILQASDGDWRTAFASSESRTFAFEPPSVTRKPSAASNRSERYRSSLLTSTRAGSRSTFSTSAEGALFPPRRVARAEAATEGRDSTPSGSRQRPCSPSSTNNPTNSRSRAAATRSCGVRCVSPAEASARLPSVDR